MRALTHVRHENIVLYMGASVTPAACDIVTNPVRAESLHQRLQGRRQQLTAKGQGSATTDVADVEQMTAVAKQLSNAAGYLHARGIVHGRISSRNVFLERKVQLSLLDYAVGCPNTVYSSPQVLSHGHGPAAEHRGESESDDVFAFGTLLYELFAGRAPLAGVPEDVAAARIRAGSLPRSLAALEATDKLKRLIQRCWDYDAARRPPFAQMVPHFAPGTCLLRRHSTSEPRLDQISQQ